MQKEIKYIGFYNLPITECKRAATLAATNKMDYISEILIQEGFTIHIVSPSWIDDSSSNLNFIRQSTIKVNDRKKITFCPSFITNAKWSRNIKIIFTLCWLFFWLILHLERNEKILMYHATWLSIPVRWAKFIRGFKLILEVEEVYGDVSVIHSYFHTLENKLFSASDAFLFSTELLSKRINSNKPYVIIYGIYINYEKLELPHNDGKTHLLYAGIIDSHKAGAFNAIECTQYLPGNFILHIIGFGEIPKLLRRIEELNQTNACKIIFDGTKSGEEFVRYSQSCHLGLSTQKMDGKYLNSSFPSKILTYLSLGLRVVSCYVECVANSRIKSLVTYYNIDTPEAIADAILSIDFNSQFDSRNLIKQLNDNFAIEIKNLIKN